MQMTWTRVLLLSYGNRLEEMRMARARSLFSIARSICAQYRTFILIGSSIWREMRTMISLAGLVTMAIFTSLQMRLQQSPKNLFVFTKTAKVSFTQKEMSNTSLNLLKNKNMALNQHLPQKSARTTLALQSAVIPLDHKLALRID